MWRIRVLRLAQQNWELRDEDNNAMTKPTLYGLWLSPYTATVAHVLQESNIAFHYKRVSPFVGNTHSEEFKTKNPFGKVPCLEDIYPGDIVCPGGRTSAHPG